ncbi:MAG: AsnC family transcriptional regulator [Rhodocyclaceae bacterium]|nr:AsnC family transcriptional regulator [Rhodocyclaceae bacterium]
MDTVDRALINRLQHGLPICAQPFACVAAEIGVDENEVITRVERLRNDGTLSRFGPLFDAACFGGAYTLAALQVPAADFDRVAALVDAHPEVAHNYAREHEWNMWFVLAARTRAAIDAAIAAIEAETGLTVLDLPKLEEFRVGAYFHV